MNYTAEDFARELLDELQRGYDIIRLSRWAMATYLKHSSETHPELDRVIMKVVAMEEGPEFELSEDELAQLAQRLTS
jgi:hypothetical protein